MKIGNELGTETEARESLFEAFFSSWDVLWRLEVGSRSCRTGRRQGLGDEVPVNQQEIEMGRYHLSNANCEVQEEVVVTRTL
jgi:hypothetical protein